MAQTAKVTKHTPKAAAPKVTTEKKERQPLKPIAGEAKVQLDSIVMAAENVVAKIESSPSVPQTYLHAFRRQLNARILAVLKARRGDPAARKRQRLEARMAKLQAELAALKA